MSAGALPPVETSTRSTPASRSSRARATESSPVQPPSTQSVAEIRTSSGVASGTAARTDSTTRSSSRVRLSKEPPYSSCAMVRERGEELVQEVAVRGVDSSTSKPASSARSAAAVKSPTTRSMSSRVSSRGLGEPGERDRPTALRSSSRPPRRARCRGPRTGAGSTPCGRRARAGSRRWRPGRARSPRSAPRRRPARRSRSRCRPARCGPPGETAVASVRTSRRRRGRTSRGARGASRSGTPSTAEYWHIGATHTRLRIVVLRSRTGVKRCDMSG